MIAEEIIELIRTLEPREVERLLVLMKDYEAELRHRQRPVRAADPQDLQRPRDNPAAGNTELFSKLAALDRRERDAQSNME